MSDLRASDADRERIAERLRAAAPPRKSFNPSSRLPQITGSDRSDRFEVRWRLESPRTLRALARHPRPEWRSAGGLALVADFERLRADDPEAAARVRNASRDAFAVIADGTLRPELDDDGDYVFTADDPDRKAER